MEDKGEGGIGGMMVEEGRREEGEWEVSEGRRYEGVWCKVLGGEVKVGRSRNVWVYSRVSVSLLSLSTADQCGRLPYVTAPYIGM